jgi:ankyrin repeat protein
MKLFSIIAIHAMFIMYHAFCMSASEDEGARVAVRATTRQVEKKASKYYNLPLFLRQHIADFAGINTPNKQGWLPLQAAVANGKLSKSLFLLEHGANPNLTNLLHPTSPLCFAASYNYCVCQGKQKEKYQIIFRQLLSLGANSYKLDESGQTAIHQAVAAHNTSALKTILKTQPNLDIKNRWGQTPYEFAQQLARNPRNHPE